MKKNRVYAGIDLDALRYNMESMHKNIKEGTKIAAVIKADAYGHGALTVAKTIEDLPYVWGFAVATADEAEMLIADGRKKPILILGISFPEHYELIVEKEIRPAICEYESAKALSDIAVRKNKTCHIHIKIDTGMSRIGLQVTGRVPIWLQRLRSFLELRLKVFLHILPRQMSMIKLQPKSRLHFFRR